jgi:hypothetical protein
MKKLQFKVRINAPVKKIYNFMPGINSKSTYGQLTSLFNPTSTYEGSWDKGNKIAIFVKNSNFKNIFKIQRNKHSLSHQFGNISQDENCWLLLC